MPATPKSVNRHPRADHQAKATRVWRACWHTFVFALPATVAAHHSISGYDAKQTVELRGTLQRARVSNPHSWFEISVPGERGNVLWTIETGGKSYVLRAIGGVLHDQFDAGQTV